MSPSPKYTLAEQEITRDVYAATGVEAWRWPAKARAAWGIVRFKHLQAEVRSSITARIIEIIKNDAVT